jgi:hypothetical protein
MPAQIRLAELIGALSHALDLTGGQLAGHCIRTAHIGTAIGRRLGLAEPQLHESCGNPSSTDSSSPEGDTAG